MIEGRYGVRGPNREKLEALHRHFAGPFSVADAAKLWSLDRLRTRRLLAQLAERKWLSRIRRDLYTAVPLGADSPGQWREDPWLVATRTFAPCYLGGWTACEHWGLTEQIFRDIVVITARRIRLRVQEIQGSRFRLKVVSEKRLFGLRNVWRGQTPVSVSDPSRTVVDLLDDPLLGGGMRQVAAVVLTYFESPMRSDDSMVDYMERFGNRTVYKRLGYLLEALDISAPRLLEVCYARRSSGISALDPSNENRGTILKRWGLRLNVDVSREPR